MKRSTQMMLVGAALALIVGPVAALADDVKEVEKEAQKTWDQINENWPEEVPTPWFCQWVGSNSVCVPPW